MSPAITRTGSLGSSFVTPAPSGAISARGSSRRDSECVGVGPGVSHSDLGPLKPGPACGLGGAPGATAPQPGMLVRSALLSSSAVIARARLDLPAPAAPTMTTSHAPAPGPPGSTPFSRSSRRIFSASACFFDALALSQPSTADCSASSAGRIAASMPETSSAMPLPVWLLTAYDDVSEQPLVSSRYCMKRTSLGVGGCGSKSLLVITAMTLRPLVASRRPGEKPASMSVASTALIHTSGLPRSWCSSRCTCAMGGRRFPDA